MLDECPFIVQHLLDLNVLEIQGMQSLARSYRILFVRKLSVAG